MMVVPLYSQANAAVANPRVFTMSRQECSFASIFDRFSENWLSSVMAKYYRSNSIKILSFFTFKSFFPLNWNRLK